MNSYNIAPSPSPDGVEIAMYSNKNGEMGIYIISMIDGKFLQRIIALLQFVRQELPLELMKHLRKEIIITKDILEEVF